VKAEPPQVQGGYITRKMVIGVSWEEVQDVASELLLNELLFIFKLFPISDKPCR